MQVKNVANASAKQVSVAAPQFRVQSSEFWVGRFAQDCQRGGLHVQDCVWILTLRTLGDALSFS